MTATLAVAREAQAGSASARTQRGPVNVRRAAIKFARERPIARLAKHRRKVPMLLNNSVERRNGCCDAVPRLPRQRRGLRRSLMIGSIIAGLAIARSGRADELKVGM